MEVIFINYKLLFNGDIDTTYIKELIAINRNLPPDWCTRRFDKMPSFDFVGLKSACNTLLQHLKLTESKSNLSSFHEKFQIIVDSDLDGICSAAILYRFLKEFYPNIETVFSIHSGKQHGLSSDIVIDDDTTLVILPDSGSNDVERCKKLRSKFVDVIVCDHHIIEQTNPFAEIVSCMDGNYPNQHICGAAVTWLFLWGFCYNCVSFFDRHQSYLLKMIDLVATATISDIMEITNDDNMYFVQNGLSAIYSNALRAFLRASEVNLNDVTIEDIKYKVSPLVSAMIRMGSMAEKTLLFRAFIDDYEEFDYEKRGSFDVATETIYDRVVRLCKNAKSRQDRAKQKMLNECKIHEYPHILLVEYSYNATSTLTGLVANELANQYSKPCIVYCENTSDRDFNGNPYNVGSIRNYDGSPIESFKSLLESSFQDNIDVAGHANAAGIKMYNAHPDVVAELIRGHIDPNTFDKIGTKIYAVDFAIPASDVDVGLIQRMHYFENFTGYGFAPVTALITGIKVTAEDFSTMGKNSFNWRVFDPNNGITYVKFKVDKDSDALVQELDSFDIGATTYINKVYVIDAICTFGLNIFKGEIHPQAIVKDYIIKDFYTKTDFDNEDDEDNFDLEF